MTSPGLHSSTTALGLAIVCPGQGAQRPGMLVPWLAPAQERCPSLIDRLSQAADLDLIKLDTEADPDQLRATQVAQPLTVATSLISAVAAGLACPVSGEDDDAQHLLALSGAAPTTVAGHSLGFLTALALAGALTPDEAVRLARLRGLAMSRCATAYEGGMTAIVGGQRSQVLAAIEEAGLETANINGSSQVVASGPTAALQALVVPNGARAVPLPVAGAFHSSAMAQAREEVGKAVSGLPSRVLSCALIDDTNGKVYQSGEDSSELLHNLPEKITQPVRWDLVHSSLSSQATGCLIELAPAGTLAALARRDLLGAKIIGLRRLDDAKTVVMA